MRLMQFRSFLFLNNAIYKTDATIDEVKLYWIVYSLRKLVLSHFYFMEFSKNIFYKNKCMQQQKVVVFSDGLFFKPNLTENELGNCMFENRVRMNANTNQNKHTKLILHTEIFWIRYITTRKWEHQTEVTSSRLIDHFKTTLLPPPQHPYTSHSQVRNDKYHFGPF